MEWERTKIKHSTLIGNYGQGGQTDLDLDAKFRSIKFTWIKKINDISNFYPWQPLADHVLKLVGGKDIFHTDLALSKTTRNQVIEIPRT